MPALFIIALIVAVLAAAAAVIGRFLPKTVRDSYGESHPRRWANGTAVTLAALGLVLTLFSSAYTVPTRNVGIETSFNKPTGEVTGAGLQWVAPWHKVEDWDAGRQSFDHKNEKTCVQVRIAGLQTACVEVLIEWSTDPEKAPEQWASYRREFKFFVDRRVDPNFTGALNDAFGDHDPLANVDPATGVVKAPDTKPLAAEVLANISSRIGADVRVHAIVFGFIRYNDQTQKQIEAYQQKILTNKNLLQDEKNAQVQKRITDTNSKVDPVTRCLEIAAQHGKEPGLCLGGGNPVQVTNK